MKPTPLLDHAEAALLDLLQATEYDDVAEVGGRPLVNARKHALQVIDMLHKRIYPNTRGRKPAKRRPPTAFEKWHESVDSPQ